MKFLKDQYCSPVSLVPLVSLRPSTYFNVLDCSTKRIPLGLALRILEETWSYVISI
jgi:hypothetical protein